ncbi:MAG: hypothetical protein HZB26_26675 [Candidatus Hydrogenedentes bacterium]|nr:hypothetical protein [Candidatus Hydrogenedentota bacterium]
MSNSSEPFLTTAIHPVECFRQGWRLIKDEYWLFFGISAVTLLLSSFAPMGLLMGPMMCGIYLCYLSKMRGERIEFGVLFRGFDYFIPSLVATLVMLGGMLVIMIPFMAIFMFSWFSLMVFDAGAHTQPGPAPGFFLGFFAIFILYLGVIVVVSLGIGATLAFAYPLIVDRKLDGIAALKLGARAAWSNRWGMAGLMLLGWLLCFVGMLFCYVGALFVAPISFGALAVSYRKVFPEIAKPVEMG